MRDFGHHTQEEIDQAFDALKLDETQRVALTQRTASVVDLLMEYVLDLDHLDGTQKNAVDLLIEADRQSGESGLRRFAPPVPEPKTRPPGTFIDGENTQWLKSKLAAVVRPHGLEPEEAAIRIASNPHYKAEDFTQLVYDIVQRMPAPKTEKLDRTKDARTALSAVLACDLINCLRAKGEYELFCKNYKMSGNRLQHDLFDACAALLDPPAYDRMLRAYTLNPRRHVGELACLALAEAHLTRGVETKQDNIALAFDFLALRATQLVPTKSSIKEILQARHAPENEKDQSNLESNEPATSACAPHAAGPRRYRVRQVSMAELRTHNPALYDALDQLMIDPYAFLPSDVQDQQDQLMQAKKRLEDGGFWKNSLREPYGFLIDPLFKDHARPWDGPIPGQPNAYAGMDAHQEVAARTIRQKADDHIERLCDTYKISEKHRQTLREVPLNDWIVHRNELAAKSTVTYPEQTTFAEEYAAHNITVATLTRLVRTREIFQFQGQNGIDGLYEELHSAARTLLDESEHKKARRYLDSEPNFRGQHHQHWRNMDLHQWAKLKADQQPYTHLLQITLERDAAQRQTLQQMQVVETEKSRRRRHFWRQVGLTGLGLGTTFAAGYLKGCEHGIESAQHAPLPPPPEVPSMDTTTFWTDSLQTRDANPIGAPDF